MGEFGGIEPPVSDGNDSGQGNESGINPAWNDMLGAIPQEIHNQVIPHLRNWDNGVNQKLQQVHQQYANFKPFVDNQVPINDLQMGYGLIQSLNQDPRKVYDAIAEHFGFNDAEEMEEEVEEGNFNLPPEIKQQLQELNAFKNNASQLLLKQQEDSLARQAEANLDKELAGLKAKYGEFDESIVLPLMASGLKGEQAVQRYLEVINGAKTEVRRPAVPPMLGNTGGIPQGGNDPTKLSRGQVKNLVAEYLSRGE